MPAANIIIGFTLAVRVNRHQQDMLHVALAAPSPSVQQCVWQRSIRHSQVGSHGLCLH